MGADSGVIGVIPAAGRAARISPLPCSKEIYPVGLRRTPDGAVRPKAACHYLLERMREAGIAKAYIVLRDGKWDIPAYLEDGAAVGMQLAYLIADSVVGTPYTVDRARAFVADANVAFGFPDMLLGSEDIFVRLLARQRESEADLILGSFPAEPGLAVDLLDVDADGRVRRLSVRPPDARLQRTWGVAVWRPAFTEYLHECVERRIASADRGEAPEASMGSVVQRAIDSGLSVEAVTVCDSPYLDIGTPEGLLEAQRRAAADSPALLGHFRGQPT